MNIKYTISRTPIISTVIFKHKKLIKQYKLFSVNKNKVEELRKNVLDYYFNESDHFAKTRKQHEKIIKKQYDELTSYGATVNDLITKSKDDIYINKNVEEIKKYLNNVKENDEKIITEIKEHTEIMRALVTSGIRIEPNIFFFFIYKLLSYMKKSVEKHKDEIFVYDLIKEKTDYIRINNYYYHKNIYPSYFSLFKSFSNLLYCICENYFDKDEVYLIIKKEIEDNYLTIDDIIRKSPSFLNISLLFFYINTWLFIDKSRKTKNTCLDYLNVYLGSISGDEINMNSDDMFYLFLTLRLYFYAFSYNEVIKKLNNFSIHFLASVVFFPHNSETFVKEEQVDYTYIIDFLNKNEKYIEYKGVSAFPFYFSLASLKNKIIYVAESENDYYRNELNIMRAYNWWKYFIAKQEGYKLLTLCKVNEFNDFLSKQKRDELMMKYINKDHIYNLNEHK